MTQENEKYLIETLKIREKLSEHFKKKNWLNIKEYIEILKQVKKKQMKKPFQSNKNATELGINKSRKFVMVNTGCNFPKGSILTLICDDE